jgi:Zn-dependent protease with chaperone function
VLLLAAAAAGALRCDRAIRRGRSIRPIAAAERIAAAGRWLLLANHALAVLVWGWLDAVRGLTGDLVLVDETIAILPPLAGAVGLWWTHYPIERRLREAMLVRRLDEGRPVHPVPPRAAYVVQQARMHLLPMLVPVLAIVGLSDAADRWIAPRLAPWAGGVVTFLVGLAVFVAAPLLVRMILSVEVLAAGEIRADIESICRRHRVRVRDFLVWRTGGMMINAAVMGIVARLRYLLLTDALLETLHRREVQAVIAHEIGHVRRHHMPWLALSLVTLLFATSALVSLPLLVVDALGAPFAQGADLAASAIAAVGALAAFGWVSRRYERQADTFAVQHLSRVQAEAAGPPPADVAAGPPAPAIVTAEAAEAMRSALAGVARLSPHDLRRRSWRHGSLAWRREYLASIIGRPIDGLPIDRLVRRLKVAAAAAFVAGSAALALLERIAPPEAAPAIAAAPATGAAP